MTHLYVSGIRYNDSSGSSTISEEFPLLDNCKVSLSPSGDFFVVAHKRTLCILTGKLFNMSVGSAQLIPILNQILSLQLNGTHKKKMMSRQNLKLHGKVILVIMKGKAFYFIFSNEVCSRLI